jgi:hypothetical protein
MQRKILAAALVAVLGGVGCHGKQTRKQPCDTCPPAAAPFPPSAGRSGGSLGEPLPPSRLPPSTVPTDPFPPASVPDSRNYRDPVGPTAPRDQPPDPRRLPPADIPLSLGDGAQFRGQSPNWLGEPVPPAGLKLPTPDAPAATGGSLPPRGPRTTAKAPTPTTTPGKFTREPIPGRDGVTSGGAVPAGGYERLRDEGIRTVVYLHDPAVSPADLADARAAATAAELRFVPVAVGPDNLPDALTTFARAVTDAPAKPIHVVDPTGVRAGSLWYLVFRTVEQRSDEVARIRATPLGLPDPDTAAGRQYWPGIRAALR